MQKYLDGDKYRGQSSLAVFKNHLTPQQNVSTTNCSGFHEFPSKQVRILWKIRINKVKMPRIREMSKLDIKNLIGKAWW